jgi:methionyl-tRNA formyltransferase
VLDALAAAPEVTLLAVVTAVPRPAGRSAAVTPTPVGERAARLGLPILTPDRLRNPAFATQLAELRPDVGILADYGKLLPPAILDLPGRGILNLHPSLLPRHRGATPIPAAIIEADAKTGVTLFRMDAGMDTGPVVASEVIAIPDDADAPSLESRLAVVAAGLLARTLGPWIDGTLPAVAQSEDGVSVTRPLRREDGRLDATRPAAALERQVRALRPWPGTFVEAAGGRIVVLRVVVAPSQAGDEPARLVDEGAGGLALATAEGRLQLLEVQPAGGRPMDGGALLRGRPGLAGTRVG